MDIKKLIIFTLLIIACYCEKCSEHDFTMIDAYKWDWKGKKENNVEIFLKEGECTKLIQNFKINHFNSVGKNNRLILFFDKEDCTGDVKTLNLCCNMNTCTHNIHDYPQSSAIYLHTNCKNGCPYCDGNRCWQGFTYQD